MRRRALLGATLALVVAPTTAFAQDDVALLGARYGATPPASYYELRDANPEAFQWDRAWLDRNPDFEVFDRGPDAPPDVRRRVDPRFLRAPGAATGPSASSAVEGTLTFPLLPGLYSDDAAPAYTSTEVDQQFFRGPNPDGTIEDFYREISGGRLQLVGETFEWRRVGMTRAQVTGGVSGLGGPSRVGEFILRLLSAWDDGTVDWGRYDNDGPDGIPNSGDDDGFVDVLTVLHADYGGECGGDGGDFRVWSHRWSLRASVGQTYVTRTPAANGGSIRVSDYTIQPALSCGGGSINSIGVLAHELGHGLGLPDLYAVDDGVSADHQGIGNWGLMGTGSWGCANSNPARPCHMSAWSKERLGWLDIVDVGPEADLGTVTLPPVVTTGRVLRVPIPGTDEYYLIENRQRLGFDAELQAPGVLFWHVDEGIVAEKRFRNRINSDPNAMGVRLIEADGRADLRSRFGNRSDDGDPFPGVRRRTAFHAGTEPSARDNSGRASKLTVRDLRLEGESALFSLTTETRRLTVRTEGATNSGLVEVDGLLPELDGSFRVAPFDEVAVTAAAGDEIAPGVRRRFERWGDGSTERTRLVQIEDQDVELLASFGQEEVRVEVEVTGEAFEVVPGRITSIPASADLWFARGTNVRLEATPTPGFEFVGWTGTEAPVPAEPLPLVVDRPLQLGAEFRFAWSFESPAEVDLVAGSDTEVTLTVGAASDPIAWSMVTGSLPEGTRFEPDGRIIGIPLVLGDFPFFVRARDALGLEIVREMRISVARPAFELDFLAAPYLSTGPGPSPGQQLWLDRQGNGDGAFDLGDLRAYLRGAPGATTVPAVAESRIEVDLTRRPEGGR